MVLDTVLDLHWPLMGCVDHRWRIIWLAQRLDAVQRRSTLAYEIAHLEHGPAPDDPRLAALYTRSCGDWAAQMLIDGDNLVAAFRLSTDLAFVAAWLEVDEQTVRDRLRGLSDGEQDAWLDAVSAVGQR